MWASYYVKWFGTVYIVTVNRDLIFACRNFTFSLKNV